MHCMEKVLRDVRTLVGDFGTLPGAEISGEKRVRDGSEVGPFWTILTVGRGRDRFGCFGNFDGWEGSDFSKPAAAGFDHFDRRRALTG